MKVRVEYAPVLENEVVLRCPRLDQEMLRVLSLVRSGLQKLCVWDENREIILLSPDETLYCESVDEHTFLYTASAFYQTALTLAELEGRYGELGYLRVSKSAVINLAPHPQPEEPTAAASRPPWRTGSGWWSPGTTRPCCGSGWDYKKEVHHGRIYPFLQLGPVHEISYGCLYPGAGLFQGHLQRPGRRGLRILAHHAPDAAGLHGGGHSGVLPFPGGPELEPSALRVRTVWWGLLCNLGFVGGALALGWFSNVPLWGGIFLVLFLEWGLSAMWFGLHVALRRDTRSLNRKLSEYQKRGPES